MKDKIEVFKEIVYNLGGQLMSKNGRHEMGKLMQDELPGCRLIDITTPDDCDNLCATYGVEMPNGRNAMIIVDTANGLSCKENIKITIL
jgi:hypothetical protein